MQSLTQIQGFKRTGSLEPITVELTWPNLYFILDEATGVKTPIRFSFTFKRQQKAERDAMNAVSFLQNKTADERRLDLFCLLLADVPRGFADFPISRDEFARLYAEPARAVWEAGSREVEFVAPEPVTAFDERPLSERARHYFGTEEMTDFVMYSMTAYDAAVVPSELLFRV